jgi:phosphoglycolate phosphatase-like HAD superfamily hydrolase
MAAAAITSVDTTNRMRPILVEADVQVCLHVFTRSRISPFLSVQSSVSTPIAIFFDLGDTLVIPQVDAGGALVALQPLPFVTDVLARLRSSGTAAAPLRLGIMSHTPPAATAASMDALLATAGILSHFHPSLRLYSSVEGHRKTEKVFFTLAATRAGLAASRCIFVGEDEKERETAASAGFHVSFHPLHLFHVLTQVR